MSVRRCWRCQSQTSMACVATGNETVRFVPLCGALPVPKKPVAAYRVESVTGTNDGAETVATRPEAK